jgi:transposase
VTRNLIEHGEECKASGGPCRVIVESTGCMELGVANNCRAEFLPHKALFAIHHKKNNKIDLFSVS